ncbi:aminotransferase class III-fold pyridoxal phosphate-dependent enzyme [Rhodococcus sp. TAF43]|uniref:aminotransferase class III-fold pyridoxal phosphate-dependent enzyme n=1 Tax=unclassified Rhodococcus (in: high G+C Gram-positive bacteria) TaxID=192944 RepID=UPI0015835040|nr:aminotransferase class III-fold pyridoxal phosphate-dependent enzyme [Rhodococcus sp. W8901]QKT09685.1 aminotransferase class III-fold pyridoxal phosphate-dependent enzyme [Rhodococcus sp. W8901]
MTETLPAASTSTGPALVTEVPGPKSRELHSRKTAAVPRGIGSALPIYIDHAEGPWLIDVDGNRFLDLGCGAGVNMVGHHQQSIIDAASAQLNRVTHTLFGITPYEGYVRLAERLSAKTPGAHAKKTMFVNSGAEAVENAVKVARAYTGRRAVASLDHGFHGRTNLTLAMNHRAVPYATGFGPFAPDVHRVPNSYPFRDGLTGQQAAARTIAYLEERVGSADLAALVVEPIQGEGGFIVPADGYLPALQEWANRNGVVLVADEIQCGLGRTGTWFASELFGLVPDVVLTAKQIAAGLPLAGVTGRAEIMDAAAPGGLGGTFGGNPVSIAAAHAVLDFLEDEEQFAAARRIGNTLTSGLRRIAETYPVIGDVRGHGAMIAFELTQAGTTRPLPGSAAAISEHAARRGVVLIIAGSDGNVIRFLPTLDVTDDLLQYALTVIEEALNGHE